ncbi:MAG: chitinase [Chitinophagaceae bacterium]|nr:chitinase [Chitinophagaceae bacterium]
MKIILTTLLLFSCLVLQAQRFKVGAYLSGDSLVVAERIPAKKITQLYYTFVSVEKGQVVSRATDSINLAQLNTLKAIHHTLNVLVSIGGPMGSAGFSEAVGSDSSREKLALSILSYLKKNSLDGIEIHWTQKARGMFGNAFNGKDQHNLVLLLQTLREKLNAQSKLDGRKKKQSYLLCMNGSSKRQYLFRSELNVAHQYLDYINLETFDYKVEILNAGGVSSTQVTGHHSNLFSSRSDSWMRLCVNRTVQEYLNHRIPSRKLMMGIPFYGQGWSNAYEDVNGLYQWAENRLTGDLSYKNIVATYLTQPDCISYWDKQAKVPYLYNQKNGTFISYDNKKSIRKKTRYVHRHRMAGAFCVDYRQDDHNTLLKPMRRGLRRIRLPFIFF